MKQQYLGTFGVIMLL